MEHLNQQVDGVWSCENELSQVSNLLHLYACLEQLDDYLHAVGSISVRHQKFEALLEIFGRDLRIQEGYDDVVVLYQVSHSHSLLDLDAFFRGKLELDDGVLESQFAGHLSELGLKLGQHLLLGN